MNANPQSRYQVTDVIANQTEAIYKFNTGPWRNTRWPASKSRARRVSRDSYTGLTSEALPRRLQRQRVALTGVNIFNPQFTFLPFELDPALTGNPTITPVDTNSVYLIDTANYNDFVILNGGVRYDHYHIERPTIRARTPSIRRDVNYNAGIVVKPLPIAQRLCGVRDLLQPGRRRTRRNHRHIWRPAGLCSHEHQPGLRPGAQQGRRSRHQVGAVRPALAGDRSAVPDRQGQRARVCRTVNGVASTVVAAAPPIASRGIDLGVGGKITDKWSVFGGLVLMQSEVLKSIVPSPTRRYTRPMSACRWPTSRISRSTCCQNTRSTRSTRSAAQATYLSKIYGGTLLAANQGTPIPDHWRFDAFVGGQASTRT